MAQLIPGLNAVLEALSCLGGNIKEIWLEEGKEKGRVNLIIKKARQLEIPVICKPKKELRQLFPDISHQGVVAVANDFSYSGLESIISRIKNSADFGLIMAVDHITDEGNLASLIRTSAFFGAHGLIIPKKRSAKVSYKVIKRASGTHLMIPICQITNLGRTLDTLDKEGFWIIGSGGEGDVSLFDFDWARDVVLVMGNEQKGLSEGIRKRCHAVIRIPSVKGVESLNVGVAAGAILCEIVRQRKFSLSLGKGES